MPGNDADQPPPKRSRVSRACDQCRPARERCEGTQPCHTCTIQDRQCSYNEQPKKRGIQPNYIRTLELTLAWLFHTFPDVEARLATVLSDEPAEVPKLITGKDATRTEVFHQAWRNGVISRQIDQALSGGPIDALQPAASADGVKQRVAQATLCSTNTNPEDAHLATPTDRPHSKLKLPDDAWTLIEYYWAFTHTWLPIAEKASVLKVVYSYPSEGIPVKDASTAEHLELWSIMALAASQLASIGRRKDGGSLHDTVRSLLPSEYDRAGSDHIKTLLLLTLLEITNERWLPAWLLVGSAIRLLSFERSSDTSAKLNMDRGLDLICLAAYVLESAVAETLHIPTESRTEDIVAIGFISEEGLEEWSPWLNPLGENPGVHGKVPARSCSTFNNVVRLTMNALDTRRNGIAKHFTASNSVDAQAGLHALATPSSSDRGHNQRPWATENVILALTRNASHATASTQKHPSAVVLARINSLTGTEHIRTNPSVPSFPSPVLHQVLQSPPQQTSQSPHVGGTIATHIADTTSNFWLQSNSMPMLNSGNGEFEATTTAIDIFEELAMLERKDTNQHQPQFMQNLGFAPDLDLAEFFGADYLPSDPMLAYIQSGPSNTGAGEQRQDDG